MTEGYIHTQNMLEIAHIRETETRVDAMIKRFDLQHLLINKEDTLLSDV